MSYLIETHYHTPETSPCCKASPIDAFPYYSDNGYNGIVITDHYFKEWFDRLCNLDWNQKIEKWLEGYEMAKEAAHGTGINIILGMELRFAGSANDYLVYGITVQLLLQHPELYKMTPRDFRMFADKHNLFFAQAHPFRMMCEPVEPEFLHGVEVFNGNPRHNSRNNLARDFASSNNLVMLSGSDFHEIEDICSGGMYLSKNPTDSQDLASLLSNRCIDGLKVT